MSRVIVVLVSVLILIVFASNIEVASANEELVAVRGETVTVSVILLQNGTYGNPVPDQRIEFFDQTNNQLLGIDITDVNGLAAIDWNIPSDYSLGPTIVNATFNGNESLFLLPSYHSITLTILASTEIVLHDIPTLLAPGDLLSFSVTLLDDASNPIINRPLSIFDDGILLASSVTNSTGSASFSIHCNSSWSSLGDNIIQIVHNQDLLNYYSEAEIMFNIEIQKLQTSIQSNFLDDAITLDENLTLEVGLASLEGGISSDLEVLLDGHTIAVIDTDYSGNGTLSLPIDEQFSLGSHVLSLVYNGSERYAETSLTLEFDVLSPAIVKITESSFITIGFDFDITISLCDILGSPIDGTIIISDITNGVNSSIQIPHETTDFKLEFPIIGPVGPHNLLIRIENPFVTNNSIMHEIIAWSQPEMSLQYSNILNFASPNQELTFLAHLVDWSGNISYQPLRILCNDEILTSSLTDEYGIATLSILAPEYEGIYNLSIVYQMNTTRYELPTKIDYHLTVSIFIPVLIELDHYEVIPPLQQVSIFLHVTCLNGSVIEGIPIRFVWESIDSYSLTQKGGISVVHLPVPDTNGNYTLYYEVEQNHNLAASSGTIIIAISLTDILTSQGIGISGFAIGIISSFVIIAIPLIRRRYLMI